MVRERLQRLAGSALRRRRLDEPLDWLRFRLDTFPSSGRLNTVYQPMPALGLEAAKRGAGTMTRWAAIRDEVRVREARTALDVGSNRGFFMLELAALGIATVGVESDPPAYRSAIYAIRRAKLQNAGVLVLAVDPSNVGLLPRCDSVLCLSLWHHFVHEHQLDGATSILEALWDRTRRVLFFDTGENEMPPSFGLPPMTPDPRTWLGEYLARTCASGEVVHLGEHDAFGPGDRPCRRNLFAVRRPGLSAAGAD